MNNNKKNIVLSLIAFVVLFSVFSLNLFLPKNEISKSERRLLAAFPKFTAEEIFNGDFSKKFENFALDQFPFRDSFRRLKANIAFDFLKQKDNNKIYVIDDNVFKIEYPLKDSSVEKFALKMNEIRQKYLKDSRVFYSVIPDKSYYVSDEYGYFRIDYERLCDLIAMHFKMAEYIDLFDALSLDSYYKTDPHWKQEKLMEVVSRLGEHLGFKHTGENYEKTELKPFLGAYYGQSALNIEPDSLIYLNNDIIKNARVYDYETKTFLPVYNLKYFDSIDPYSLFLNGGKAILSIENPCTLSKRELIIFRDSFASCLAPLLFEYYSKITLIDVRYVSSDVLEEYIDFHGQDTLFLYSSIIYNNSDTLR